MNSIQKKWELPFSQYEINQILEIRHNDLALTWNQANNENIFRILENTVPPFIHFSTHAAYLSPNLTKKLFYDVPDIDPNEPFSRAVIFLSGGYHRAQHGAGPGVLNAWGLASLNLHGTKLVTLSACDTGQGDTNAGAGVKGLVQALFMAGTRYVLSSLWAVDDQRTANFMGLFYRHLEKTNSISIALRNVKLEFLEQAYSPTYWAGFVLNGFDAIDT